MDVKPLLSQAEPNLVLDVAIVVRLWAFSRFIRFRCSHEHRYAFLVAMVVFTSGTRRPDNHGHSSVSPYFDALTSIATF